MNLNIYTGRLIKEPVVREVNNSKVASFVLAVKRKFKNSQGEYDSDFIPVECWRGVADIAEKYLKKGNLVTVVGRMEIKRIENGNTYNYYPKCVVETIDLLPNNSNVKSDTVLDNLPPFD